MPYYAPFYRPTYYDPVQQSQMGQFNQQFQQPMGQPMQNAQMPMQSYSAPPIEQVENYIQTNGDSEFLKAVDGRKADKVLKLIDELVEAVKILHPRMYTTFIDKVQDL